MILNAKAARGCIIIGRQEDFFIGVEVVRFDVASVERRRHPVDNGIEKLLDPFVFKGRSARTGLNLLLQTPLRMAAWISSSVKESGFSSTLFMKASLVFIDGGELFEELRAHLFALFEEIGRDICFVPIGSQMFRRGRDRLSS